MSDKKKSDGPTLSQIVAAHVVKTGYGDLTETAIAWAKNSIIDTLGVALAGADQENATIVAQVFAGSQGDCVLYGMKKRAAALDAAMINGTSSHVLDFDASNDTFAGHPSVHILPAIWAAGEERNLNGKDLITAHAIGFEVQSRLGRLIQPEFGDGGWFPSSSLGVFGTAAAVAHMLRLDEEKTTHALGIASNFASGMMVNAGTMTKPLAAGQGARNGLLAALLAEKGLTSAVNALEDKRGFLPLYAKAVLVPSEIETVFADWGKPYEVEETAVGLKRHPCCGVLQSTIDVAIDLAKENDFTPDQIEGMDILLMTSRFGHVDRPHPKSGIDAKFSVQYCLARAIRDKGVTIADFEEGGYEDAGVAALMTKVHAAVNPSMKGTGRDQQGGADITVRLKDGRKFHGARLKPLGREAGKPLSDVQIDDKFRDCASRTVKREGIEPLVGKLRGLEILASIKQLSDFLFDVTA